MPLPHLPRHVTTMDSGDKMFVKFQGGGTVKDGKLVSDDPWLSKGGGAGRGDGHGIGPCPSRHLAGARGFRAESRDTG